MLIAMLRTLRDTEHQAALLYRALRLGGAWVLAGCSPAAVAASLLPRPPCAGGLKSEAAWREWLGLGGLPAGLVPQSLALFARVSCTHLLSLALEGLHTFFPEMVLTGALWSKRRLEGLDMLGLRLPGL